MPKMSYGNPKGSLQVNESNSEHKGRKYPAKAAKADLAEGVSHHQKGLNCDGMYARNEKKQRMPKGNDRI